MSNPAAETAIGPMVIAAVEQHEPVGERIVFDDLARRMLPSAAKVLVRACGWRPLRRFMVNGLNKQAPGMWESFLCRKRYLDDVMDGSSADGIQQVVILGSGMDTRGLRHCGSCTVFEVDLPINIVHKRARVQRALGHVPAGLRLTPCDFESDDLSQVLTEAGLRFGVPTVFVWEAVTQYLTVPAVRAVFEVLDAAAAGSKLAFTYVRDDFLRGRELFASRGLYRRFVVQKQLWRFGWLPDEVAGFLAHYGWREVEQLGATEYTQRYLSPAGRKTVVSEVERMVLAAKV